MKKVIYVLAIYAAILSNVYAAVETEGVNLYIAPDDRKPDRAPPDVDGDDQLADPRKADKEAYPALYRLRGEAKAIIVVFGFPTCGWCRVQERAIPKNYNMLAVNKDDLGVAGGEKTWRDLMKQWEVGGRVPVYPTTVVVVDGLPVKTFTSYKPWKTIKPHAVKAKIDDKEDDTKRNNRNDRRGNRDWWQRSLDSPRNGRRHVPQFGRWSRRFITGRP